VLLVTVGQGVFRGLQNMRAPLLVTAGTNALHGLLDVVLMFQLGWGIRGAAVSTAASEWLAAAAYVWLVWQRRDVLGLWPPPPRVPLRQLRARLAPFLQAGGAVVMRTGSLLGTKTLAAAVATRLGPTSVASHQVLMQLWVLSSMLVDALAVSGQTLIAVHLGQGRPGTARQIGERLLQLGCGLGLGLALVSGVTAAWWPQLFTAGETACVRCMHQRMPWSGAQHTRRTTHPLAAAPPLPWQMTASLGRYTHSCRSLCCRCPSTPSFTRWTACWWEPPTLGECGSCERGATGRLAVG
jgi:putative MATE family efflux protein